MAILSVPWHPGTAIQHAGLDATHVTYVIYGVMILDLTNILIALLHDATAYTAIHDAKMILEPR